MFLVLSGFDGREGSIFYKDKKRFLHMLGSDFREEILNNFDQYKQLLETSPVLAVREFSVDTFNLEGQVYIRLNGEDSNIVIGNISIEEFDANENLYGFRFIKSNNYFPIKISDFIKECSYLFTSNPDWIFHRTHLSVCDKNIDDLLTRFKICENKIIEGVAGSGKSHMLQELCTSGFYGNNGSRIEVVVFHPSTSYEEFVSGVRPNFNKRADEGDFVTQEGAFVQMCNRAAQDPDNAYLLFIDEINRANTSRVFGDLMLVLEKSKRQDFAGLSLEGRDGALFEASVQEMPGDYVRLQTPIFKNGKEYNKLAVPTNLHVLGTMNTTDRSVGTIDLALRRRFHWVTQHPLTAEELQKAMEENGEKYPADIASWYENANLILLNQVGPDARLGHAYFFGKDGDEEAIAEALLNQLKEVAFTFNISQTILDEIGPVHGQKIFIRGAGLGARPDIVDEPYQG